MNEFLEQLLADGPVITDGAWGTQLQLRGLPSGHCPDEWNRSHPERVEEVARAYVEEGSQIILTNTFRANRLALAHSDLVEEVAAINKAGVEISRRAADGRASVFGSIGPSGKMLFAGEVSEVDLQNAMTEQIEALADAGVAALVVETMSDLAEAKVALVAAKRTGLPVIVCMVFDSGRELDRTMMGVTAKQAAEQLTDAGADGIGANCGQSIDSYVDLCRQLNAATSLPIWIKPNAGVPRIEGDETIYGATAEEFAKHASRLFEAGASFLGGCCGTSPEFVTALSGQIR